MLTDPANLGEDDALRLKDARVRCRHLDVLAERVAAFAKILTNLAGDRLDAWVERVQADDLPHLRSFVAGLGNDDAAVRNGLTLPHSSGAVEGNVNRIKTLKRQMYGWAKFDLLRTRVLLAH